MESSDWEKDYRLSLCCTWDGALERFIKSHEIKEIVFCLDDDDAGNKASDEYLKEYAEKGYEVARESPIGNDYNEELLNCLDEIKLHEENGG